MAPGPCHKFGLAARQGGGKGAARQHDWGQQHHCHGGGHAFEADLAPVQHINLQCWQQSARHLLRYLINLEHGAQAACVQGAILFSACQLPATMSKP